MTSKAAYASSLLATALLATWALGQPAARGGPEAAGPDPAAARPDLTQPLAEVLQGKIALDQVRLSARWADPASGGASFLVYGNGIGIWNNRVQFALTDKQVLHLLGKLQKAGFTKMPGRFGGLEFKGRGPRPGAPEILRGEITLTIAGKSQGVIQLGNGFQSKEFAALAAGLLQDCADPAAKGTGAADLADGLGKIAARKLDPLTLGLLVHRIKGEGIGPDGWLMRVEGSVVVTRERDKKGYGTEIRYELSRKELENLLKLLVDNDAGRLPINLYAPDYTDFRVSVLDKEKSLQARKFARLTPTTHGERQQQFDRIFTALHQLHLLALKKGNPVKQ